MTMRRLDWRHACGFVLAVLCAGPAAAQAPAAPKPALTPSPDPASSHFTSEAGILLVTVKPAATADYELAIKTLQEALAKDLDPNRSAAAKGWHVFKANEPDTKGNPLYVHIMLPAVPNFDYRPSLLLDELVKELPLDLLSKYADSFAEPPRRLNLIELANMSVTPIPETKKPGGD